MASHTTPSPLDPTVAVKITISGKDEHRKFKLTMKDLGASVLPDKLRSLLSIPPTKEAVFERYSDSSASFITLDSNNPSVYKQLYRAAKAKGKLRLKATINEKPVPQPEIDGGSAAETDRLPSRSYVHPYVCNVDTDQTPSSRISTLEDWKTLSAAPSTITLTPSTKENTEIQKDQTPAYHWPMSQNSKYSDTTKAKFENKTAKCHQIQAGKIEEDGEDEAPLPRFFSPREQCLAQLAAIQHKHAALRNIHKNTIPTNFTIYCNHCDRPVPDAHWHCGICDGGDYDLCQDCVKQGRLCTNEDHWLIKRFLKDGEVINSTTETMAPKKSSKLEPKDIPGAFTSDVKTDAVENLERTCNSCVQVFHESNFVTCTSCDDYDLCVPCHVGMRHGHHPSHTFQPASKSTSLDSVATKLLGAGRGIHHWAVCDGCDKNIYGIRHKCLNCPDWDFCSDCAVNACKTHPGHRFVALNEPIVHQPQPNQVHHGICCDGPLCEGKGTYIVGDRYKCAVCHDTDFCAKCEALPRLKHNRTHPLLKFKTPVRNVSVSTYGEKVNGEPMRPMGDQPPQTSSKSTETTLPSPSANAATQVQTVVEVKPTPMEEQPKEEKSKSSSRRSLASTSLQASFVRDTIADGSIIAPNTQFTQVWTLRNQGPRAWPAGCSVCFVGGDSMLDVDSNHPSSIAQLNKALSTNSIDRPIEQDEEADFSVSMRTPLREGKAISYWRLKTEDGAPFGHRLWCDVDVRKTSEIEAVIDKKISTEQVNAAPKSEMEQEQKNPKTSQMIFPTLEKESPVSSTHEAQPSLTTPTAPVTLSPAEQDLLEDVESLELDDESSDEGFLTDEEYELIASGDEMEVAKNGKK